MWTGLTYRDPIVIKDDYKKMEDAISSEEKSATPNNCHLRRHITFIQTIKMPSGRRAIFTWNEHNKYVNISA